MNNSPENENANARDEQVQDIREVLAFSTPLTPATRTVVPHTETDDELTARLTREYRAQQRDRTWQNEEQAVRALTEVARETGRPIQTAQQAPVGRPEPDYRPEINAAILGDLTRELFRLEHSRRLAARDAEQAPMRRDEEAVKQILGDRQYQLADDFLNVQEELRESRKPTMQTKEHYLCDSCQRIITNPAAGFVIQGNIYVADTASLGGLVGNNIPEADENGHVRANAIKKTVLCDTCLKETLGLGANDFSKVAAKTNMVAGSIAELFGATQAATVRRPAARRPDQGDTNVPLAERAARSGISPAMMAEAAGIQEFIRLEAQQQAADLRELRAAQVASNLPVSMEGGRAGFDGGGSGAIQRDRVPTSTRDILAAARRAANLRASSAPIHPFGQNLMDEEGGMGPIGGGPLTGGSHP